MFTRPDPSTLIATDPGGRALTFVLTDGRITRVTDAAVPPRTVSYTYDGAGDLTDIVDVNGGHQQFTYDAAHRLLTMRSPRFFGDTTTTPTPVVTNHYDALGRVEHQSDELGRMTTWDYTTPGTTRVTNPKGSVTLHTYRDGELLVALTKGVGTPEAASWSYAYDTPTLDLTAMTDPNNNTATMAYDERGNMLSAVDPLGRRSAYTWDALNSVTSITDPKGVTTTFEYDAAGNLLRRSRPLLSAAGDAVATQTATYHYGEGSGAQAGDITSLVDPNGQQWRFGYDQHGHPDLVVDPLGHRTTAVYDDVGRIASQTSAKGNMPGADPAAFTTTFSHDADNSMTGMVDPSGRSIQRRYDANRNVTLAVDGNGNRTSYTYDAADQPTVVTRADGTTTRREFWPDGTLQAQVDALGQVTRYDYDALARLTAVTDALGRTTAYGYDAAGNVITRQDPGGTCPNLGCTSTTYDAANQLRSIAYSDATTPDVNAIEYDADGQRVRMVDAAGTSTWTWDSLNRLIASSTGAGQSVGYGYDLKGQLTTIGYPGAAKPLARDFDAAGNLSSVEDWLGNRSTFGYDPNDNLVEEAYANGTRAALAYDAADRLLTIEWTRPARGSTTTIAPPSLDPSEGTGAIGPGALEGNGTRTDSESDGGLRAKTRGLLARTGGLTLGVLLLATVLIAVGVVLWRRSRKSAGGPPAGPGQAIVGVLVVVGLAAGAVPVTRADASQSASTSFLRFSYERDTSGRLSSVTSTGVPADDHTFGYTALNQLATDNGSTFSYDPAGNLTGLPDGTIQAYDAAHQLCWAAAAGSGTCALPPPGATTYEYDARGNRTSTAPPNGAARLTYHYDQANRLVAAPSATYTYNGEGLRTAKTVSGTTTAFTWNVAEGLPLVLAETSEGATTSYVYGPGGRPLQQVGPTGEVRFHHHDQRASTRALTDSSGEVTSTFTYDSYGRSTAATGTTSTPLGFAGEYTDAETGFLYLRARYYDPATGQFITRDPLEIVSRSAYGYVEGDPLNEVDPSGLWPHFVIAGAIGAVVGAVSGGVQHVVQHGFTDPRRFGASVLGGAVSGAVVGSCTVGTGQVAACGAAGSVAGGWLTAKVGGDDYSLGDAGLDALIGGTVNVGVDRFSPWPINTGWFRPTKLSNLWNPGPYARRIYRNEILNSLGSMGGQWLKGSLVQRLC
ncbi:MAG TPA: RHS repeat-associated core domain-containing protein [Acidimicrobiales bacterium]|nr:RHS repeat-associated core domain-containing protein [Acidimicrobiales bacterium]